MPLCDLINKADPKKTLTSATNKLKRGLLVLKQERDEEHKNLVFFQQRKMNLDREIRQLEKEMNQLQHCVTGLRKQNERLIEEKKYLASLPKQRVFDFYILFAQYS